MKNIMKLEENSTSENNSVKPPVPIIVESVSAKAEILQLDC